MAIAFDASTSNAPGIVSSVSFSHTTSSTADRIMFITSITNGENADLSGATVTYNSVAATYITRINATNAVHIWYLANPSSGSNTVSITGGGEHRYDTFAATYTGAAGTIDSSNTGSAGSGANFTLTTTVVASNCWLFGTAMCATSSAVTAGTGTTVRSQITNDNGRSSADGDSNTTVSTGSQSLVFSNGGASPTWTGVIVSFAPPPPTSIKTVNDLAKASVKTVKELAIASVKTINDLA